MAHISCEALADIAISHGDYYGHPIDALAPSTARIVEAIIADLSDRRGLRQEWEQIDSDVQDEIRYVWGIIIEKLVKLPLDTTAPIGYNKDDAE